MCSVVDPTVKRFCRQDLKPFYHRSSIKVHHRIYFRPFLTVCLFQIVRLTYDKNTYKKYLYGSKMFWTKLAKLLKRIQSYVLCYIWDFSVEFFWSIWNFRWFKLKTQYSYRKSWKSQLEMVMTQYDLDQLGSDVTKNLRMLFRSQWFGLVRGILIKMFGMTWAQGF